MRKKYLIEIRVRDTESGLMVVDFCQYRDTKLECGLDLIEAKGKVEMSHLFDLFSEQMSKQYGKLKGENESSGQKTKGQSA